jgi:hypothetical protein
VGVQSDLVIPDLAEARVVAESESPVQQWEGFTFAGPDNIKLCTLLSLLVTGDPMQDFDRYLDLVEDVAPSADRRPVVFAGGRR